MPAPALQHNPLDIDIGEESTLAVAHAMLEELADEHGQRDRLDVLDEYIARLEAALVEARRPTYIDEGPNLVTDAVTRLTVHAVGELERDATSPLLTDVRVLRGVLVGQAKSICDLSDQLKAAQASAQVQVLAEFGELPEFFERVGMPVPPTVLAAGKRILDETRERERRRLEVDTMLIEVLRSLVPKPQGYIWRVRHHDAQDAVAYGDIDAMRADLRGLGVVDVQRYGLCDVERVSDDRGHVATITREVST